MRIAVFVKSTTFHTGYGGLETQNKLLCEGLVKKGHDISVFSPQRELKFETKYDNGVKYHFLPSIYKLTSFKNKQNWVYKSVEAFKKHYLDNPFNLVVSQSSAGLGVIKNKAEFNVPIISISHGTIIGEFRTNIQVAKGIKGYLHLLKDAIFVLRVFFGRQRQFIHGSNKIVAVSSVVKEALINETFVSEEKIIVINNGIDPALFKNDSFQNSPDFSYNPTILYVGQITRSKGLDTVLKLALEPEFSNIEFNIIGGGDYLEELKSLSEKENITSRFKIHGKKPYAELITYLNQLQNAVFVFPTKRYEGFPMVLVESLFLGFPVVAYDVGGVKDAVINGETGALIPSEEYGTFKEAVLKIAKDVQTYKTYSENSRKYAYNNLTSEKMIERYEQVFKEVLEKHENITNNL